MEEKECKYCAMLIPIKARLCPYCRHRVSGVSRYVVLIGVLVALFFLVSIILATMVYKEGSRFFSGSPEARVERVMALQRHLVLCDKIHSNAPWVCVREAKDKGYSIEEIINCATEAPNVSLYLLKYPSG